MTTPVHHPGLTEDARERADGVDAVMRTVHVPRRTRAMRVAVGLLGATLLVACIVTPPRVAVGEPKVIATADRFITNSNPGASPNSAIPCCPS